MPDEPAKPKPARRTPPRRDPAAADPRAPEPATIEQPPEVADERPALARFVAGAEPVVGRVTSAVESVLTGAGDAIQAGRRRWSERPGARVRRVRRLARQSLPMLYNVHPEARRANPRELGLQTLDPEDIAGSAVSGIDQRGGDFLPLRPFRSPNWQTRWQRVRNAVNDLRILPPIEVVKFDDRYWVLDGHNRVAAALYNGQAGIDAVVTELVLPGQNPSERPASLAATLGESRALRSAGHGDRPSGSVQLDDRIGPPLGSADARADTDHGAGDPDREDRGSRDSAPGEAPEPGHS
jgi:hypothetical protein